MTTTENHTDEITTEIEHCLTCGQTDPAKGYGECVDCERARWADALDEIPTHDGIDFDALMQEPIEF